MSLSLSLSLSLSFSHLKDIVDPGGWTLIGLSRLTGSECFRRGRLLPHDDLVDVVDQEDQELVGILEAVFEKFYFFFPRKFDDSVLATCCM